jgi:acyl-CoA synthetase (AMP-forming)/AMP-acid ligase II
MMVMALKFDRSDVILNPYPLTAPTGLALGLMPWLISGCTLLQHQPFDAAAFEEQLIEGGATVTALPSAVIAGTPERWRARRFPLAAEAARPRLVAGRACGRHLARVGRARL